jgi:hypothetical protein
MIVEQIAIVRLADSIRVAVIVAKPPERSFDPVSLFAGEHKAYHESWMKPTYSALAQHPLTA